MSALNADVQALLSRCDDATGEKLVAAWNSINPTIATQTVAMAQLMGQTLADMPPEDRQHLWDGFVEIVDVVTAQFDAAGRNIQ